jgi:carbon monoxide dehydrogenase subunit G
MPKLELSTSVSAPRERVFEVFSDLRGAAGRIPDITKMEVITEGPVGEGTRWRETRVMFKKEHTEEMWISAFEPPDSYTVQADTCGADYFTTFTFTPAGEGTRVDVRFRSNARTLGGWLMAPLGFLFKGMLRKCLEKDLAALKQAAESPPVPSVST